MHARILGSFRLEEGGQRIPLGGARQRAVLVSLLLHANEVVPSEQLLMDLWGEDAPLSAANSLHAVDDHFHGNCRVGRQRNRGAREQPPVQINKSNAGLSWMNVYSDCRKVFVESYHRRSATAWQRAHCPFAYPVFPYELLYDL